MPPDPAADLWYKDAIIYEAHVRAFHDSNADGVGDFTGLIDKLDYLQELGVTALWLLPFYPSPLKDDGYDIADYTGVNPAYGSLRDVRRVVKEAHRRGLRVITELVCNHTSDQHAWFQRARRAKRGTAMRDFYVWSDTTDKYREARIIFRDFESSNWTWDGVAQQYYWHRFYSHQPDLNYDNPAVQRAMIKILDFWLDMGIDGLRLDAVPYLFEREGTNCENLPETHAFLRKLRAHVERKYPGTMLLAEANQWPEDAVSYFGDGDECHMAFHFPLMPRLFMGIRMEDRFPIVDILAQTPPIPENSQWALFLRNHDELTLEMVTDEERDYMYQAYTRDPEARINLGIRRRLAPLLQNNRRRVELMNALLFSLPGTPVLYYGDEIGMGDNIYLGDRNGVRTPMQWSADRNAGFSKAERQRLFLPVIVDAEYHYEAVNVETQAKNPQSLLSFMRRLITLRKRHAAFGRGTLEFLHPANRKVLAFVRRYEDEVILVVANLSRFVQFTDLDLGTFEGMQPVEMFGRTEFPPVGSEPYFLTLGPHAYYWFTLEPQRARVATATASYEPMDVPELAVGDSWTALLTGEERSRLEQVLPSYLQDRRWFGGKARRISAVRIKDSVPVPYAGSRAQVALLDVDYREGDPETYVVPFAFAAADRAEEVWKRAPHSVVARVDGHPPGVLYDCLSEAAFAETLLDSVVRRRRHRSRGRTLAGVPTRTLRARRISEETGLHAAPSDAEQTNNSIIFGEQMILKLYRRLEPGENPDLEVGRFLTERARFPNIAQVYGHLELKGGPEELYTLGLLQAYVPNQGDAWAHTREALADFLQLVQERRAGTPPPPAPSLTALGDDESPAAARDLIGDYLDQARLLGRRTAEMHMALASDREDPAFAPEPPSMMAQRSAYQSARTATSKVLATLRQSLPGLPEPLRVEARRLLELEPAIQARLRGFLEETISADRIRCHGDYHLGQVLWTGSDYVIIDFEGEPSRTLHERRLKRYSMRDVAGMVRSFDYAAQSALGDATDLAPWARYWAHAVARVFVQEYLDVAQGAVFLPPTRRQAALLLRVHLIEKAVYELGYELNSRPGWLPIPIAGLLELGMAPD